jgi:hypothetical protein
MLLSYLMDGFTTPRSNQLRLSSLLISGTLSLHSLLGASLLGCKLH